MAAGLPRRRAMSRKTIFFALGALMGIVVFWGPTVLRFGNNFSDPFLFVSLVGMYPWVLNHWLLPGLVYVAVSAIPFLLVYFLSSDRRPPAFFKALSAFKFFSLGLYISLTAFFLLLGLGLSRGGF